LTIIVQPLRIFWSQESELNRRPTDYEVVWAAMVQRLYSLDIVDFTENQQGRYLPETAENCPELPRVYALLRTVCVQFCGPL